MIKAIIFDCFGVLLADVLRTKAIELQPTNPEGAEIIFSTFKLLDRGLMSREDGLAAIAPVLSVSVEEVDKMIRDGEVRNGTLLDFIPSLRPTYHTAVLSNVRSRVWLQDRFLPHELEDTFDTVVASGDVGMVKPEPGIYHLTAERLGVLSEECVMIDDLESGCNGALAVGMQAIRYVNNQQLMDDLQALLAG